MQKNRSLLLNIGKGLSLVLGVPTIAFWDTRGRPKKPKRGMVGFNIKTNTLEYYNGSYWLGAAMMKA